MIENTRLVRTYDKEIRCAKISIYWKYRDLGPKLRFESEPESQDIAFRDVPKRIQM